jgi:hypothetical protein
MQRKRVITSRANKTVALAIGVGLLWYRFVLNRRVPVLSAFDLGIHEFGHLVMSPAPEVVMFLAGSAAQLIFPLGIAIGFWYFQRHHIALALCCAWAAESAVDVAIYIAESHTPGRNDCGCRKRVWAGNRIRRITLIGMVSNESRARNATFAQHTNLVRKPKTKRNFAKRN